MKKRQDKIARTAQRRNSKLHHLLAANGVDGSNSLTTQYKTREHSRFDVINKAFLGTHREVFNAWDPTESKVFTFLKTVYDRMMHPEGNMKQLQLIPIDPRQEDSSDALKNCHESL